MEIGLARQEDLVDVVLVGAHDRGQSPRCQRQVDLALGLLSGGVGRARVGEQPAVIEHMHRPAVARGVAQIRRVDLPALAAGGHAIAVAGDAVETERDTPFGQIHADGHLAVLLVRTQPDAQPATDP